MSAAAGRRPSLARLLAAQLRYQILLLLRTPSGPFFTFAIPLMLLVALNLVYGDQRVMTRDISFADFYTPSMVAFAIANACYINVVNGIVIARQSGMLKRVRGTPLPGWVYLGGRVGASGMLAALSALGVVVIGTTIFDGVMATSTAVWAVAVLVLSMACFCAVGLAVTPLVPSAEAALPFAYGSFLPVAFISDVFFPSDTSPAWLRTAASAFPVRPLARSLQNAFVGGTGFHPPWTEMGVLGAWTISAAVLVAMTFRWEPAGTHRGGRSERLGPSTLDRTQHNVDDHAKPSQGADG